MNAQEDKVAGKKTAPRIDPGVWDHPKTQLVAQRCRMQPERVVYHLTQMWAAVLRNNRDGLLFRGSTDPKEQERIQSAFGEEIRHDKPGRFLEALIKARFVDQLGSAFVVHDWGDWQDVSRARARAQSNYPYRDSYSDTGDVVTTPEGSSSGVDTSGVLTPDSYNTLYDESGGRERGAGGRGNYVRKTTGEGPTSSAPFTRFTWWVVEGFGETYAQDAYDPNHLSKLGKHQDMSLVAECYIAIHQGLFGDDFDRRNLTARHAMKKSGAFAMFKKRKRIDGTLIALTPEGAQYHPSAARRGAEVARGDAGAFAAGNGATDPFAGSDGGWDLENDSKVREFRSRQAADQQDIAF